MNIFLAVLVGLLSVLPSKAKDASPDVQVYSKGPGIIGEPNTLICHVKGFYPPEISIKGIHLDVGYVSAPLLQVCSVQAKQHEEDWNDSSIILDFII
ncbi:hypothetical protein CesoFtcFv8_026095 [Champsocephalus esox]|uniref:Immunoglobulin C1-set domain-containing protein n=1 Tax=Champsocephalus esox TaxID=159716 RepID=A0AAN8GEV4_9TELE|nr:hypothetical protein CesoFtcFv8_026095 [Champsocephalus esox]